MNVNVTFPDADLVARVRTARPSYGLSLFTPRRISIDMERSLPD